MSRLPLVLTAWSDSSYKYCCYAHGRIRPLLRVTTEYTITSNESRVREAAGTNLLTLLVSSSLDYCDDCDYTYDDENDDHDAAATAAAPALCCSGSC